MSWITDFLDWLYSVAGLEVEVFDTIYDAAINSNEDSDTLKAVIEWYKKNIDE